MIGRRSGDLIPGSIKTVPELLADQGYRTLGISENAYAGEAKGLNNRFDDFTKSSPRTFKHFLSYHQGISLLKYGFKLRKHGPGLSLDQSAHGAQNSFFTTDITKRKLRQLSGEPFFCYVHYDDPHHPYIPPLSYLDEYTSEIDASPTEARDFAWDMHENLYEYMADGVPFSDRQWAMLHAMYDASIKYVDECVGHLFDFVQDHFEDTIVVITADHGDLFGEQGLLGHHIVLHDALIHVPMVTHGLEDIDRCTDLPVQHLDIMKTILSAVGADIPQFQGFDLRDQCREFAISQDLRGSVDDESTQDYESIRQHNPEIDLSHLPQSLLTSVRTTEFKLLHTDEWTRLYQLPDESKDVKDDYPTEYDQLYSFVQDWLKSAGKPLDITPNEADLTDETEQHLQEMGYLQ